MEFIFVSENYYDIREHDILDALKYASECMSESFWLLYFLIHCDLTILFFLIILINTFKIH